MNFSQVLKDKVAEISLPPEDSNEDRTGDTPTMYAGIKNMTEHEEEKSSDGGVATDLLGFFGSVCTKTINDMPEGQMFEPSSGGTLFFFIPPSTSLVRVLNSGRAF